MTRTIRLFALSLAMSLVWMAGTVSQANAQATSGTISGVVTDERRGGIANATVTARNVGTNESRATTGVDGEGRYHFPNLPVGNYEITVQADGFAKLVRSGIELLLNQDAVVNVALGARPRWKRLSPSPRTRRCEGYAEVSTRFDTKRLSETAARAQPQYFERGAVGGRRQSTWQRPDRLRPGRGKVGKQISRSNFGKSSALEQLHVRRPGQQRSKRLRFAAADQQSGRSARTPFGDKSVRGGIWPRRRLGRQRHHQSGNKRVSRLGLLVQ